MYRFARNEEIDLDELRTRLRKMTDEDLLRFGKAARFMYRRKKPRQAFLIQLMVSASGKATATSKVAQAVAFGYFLKRQTRIPVSGTPEVAQ